MPATLAAPDKPSMMAAEVSPASTARQHTEEGGGGGAQQGLSVSKALLHTRRLCNPQLSDDIREAELQACMQAAPLLGLSLA